jgi:hypothetical protein
MIDGIFGYILYDNAIPFRRPTQTLWINAGLNNVGVIPEVFIVEAFPLPVSYQPSGV